MDGRKDGGNHETVCKAKQGLSWMTQRTLTRSVIGLLAVSSFEGPS